MTDTGTNTQTADEKLKSWFQTYSGIRFFPWAPSTEMVCLEDIAHHTSQAMRWAGATRWPMPVAYHNVMCWRLAIWLYPDRPDVQKWALFHDTGEAYVMDMIRPIKKFFPEYQGMEAQVLMVIAHKYGLGWPMPEEVKRIDNLQLAIENRFIVHKQIPGLYDDLYEEFVQSLPETAKPEFMDSIGIRSAFWFMPEPADAPRAKDLFLDAVRRVGISE